ncbi:MAG: DUF4159 domain-containing protein [Deltaproteobacteria bacterium]|jgi:hypothetical protein|nr:DUF4159 domain-containing protein [Deltaproteobacteria bacterium]
MKKSFVINVFFLLLLIDPAGGQEESMLPATWREPADEHAVQHEFIFVRGKYTNYSGSGGPGYGYGGTRRQWWETDFDDADRNLLRGLQRYTTMDASSRGYKAMSLTDPALFEHPFLYINMKRIPLYSGNGPNFKPEETAVLREYMLRGGFVMLDDFWGPEHWQDFLVELAKIFPDRRPEKLPIDHPIFHCFFDIREIKQVPGRGVTWGFGMGFMLDSADYPTTVHGVFDDDGRLMMAVNFNTDLGDGWEHTFDAFYPTRYCNAAYKIGINTIVYALSH